MPSYKIHSLKDSNKLSFIIEGESENSVQKKLSGEGYIVLSVEKTEIDTGKIFVFEGKRSNREFIEGKIEADNIFRAYEMLTKEYSYTITKLYPSSITDAAEQQKIFQELLGSFDGKKTETKKVVVDTASKALKKSKAVIEMIISLLKTEHLENADSIIIELKKLDQSTNNSTTDKKLKETLKNLISIYRNNVAIFTKLKAIARELNVFILPQFCFTIIEKLKIFFTFLGPVFHPETHSNPSNNHQGKKNIQEDYIHIHTNPNIQSLIKKKYRKFYFSSLFKREKRQPYIYSTYRSNRFFYLVYGASSSFGRVIRCALLFLLFGFLLVSFLGLLNNIFVFDGVLIIFGILIVISLVIPSEPV